MSIQAGNTEKKEKHRKYVDGCFGVTYIDQSKIENSI